MKLGSTNLIVHILILSYGSISWHLSHCNFELWPVNVSEIEKFSNYHNFLTNICM